MMSPVLWLYVHLVMLVCTHEAPHHDRNRRCFARARAQGAGKQDDARHRGGGTSKSRRERGKRTDPPRGATGRVLQEAALLGRPRRSRVRTDVAIAGWVLD